MGFVGIGAPSTRWLAVIEPAARTGGAVVSRALPDLDADRVAALLDLEPLPHEGGRFRRTHLDAHSSAIYYLLAAGEFSALHALASTETYHWHAGSPLRLLLLHPDGRTDEPVLGPDLAAGQRPQLVVPAGVWQGSTSDGAWSLVGAITAPPFRWADFRLGERADLAARYPAVRVRIEQLTGPAR